MEFEQMGTFYHFETRHVQLAMSTPPRLVLRNENVDTGWSDTVGD